LPLAPLDPKAATRGAKHLGASNWFSPPAPRQRRRAAPARWHFCEDIFAGFAEGIGLPRRASRPHGNAATTG